MGAEPGISQDKAAPPKNKGGRPKGYPKSGGRTKDTPPAAARRSKSVPPGLTPAERRVWLADASRYFDFLTRMATGKSIKYWVKGPTGKAKIAYHRPSIADMKWAVEIIGRKCLPDLGAVQLTGEDGGPVAVAGADLSDASPMELARRLETLFETLGVTDVIERALGASPRPPLSLSPALNGEWSPVDETAAGGTRPPGDEVAPQEPPEADLQPIKPEKGETAHYAFDVEIKNHGPQRPNLPDDSYQLNVAGRAICYGNWATCARQAERLGADLCVGRIERPREPSAARWASPKVDLPRPEVGYAHRK